ncbi:MAG TPA: OmpA family protein [Chthoniobacter sp.]|nr:OmpA family protein [Chthoniobacter sp.]
MAQYSTYQSNAAEIPIMRKWLLRALLISLLIHGGLLFFFNFKHLENFGYTEAVQLAPTPIRMRQVTIADTTEAETIPEPTKKTIAPIPIEETKPMVDEIQIKPNLPDTAPIVQEKPKVDLTGFDANMDKSGTSMAALEQQLRGKLGSELERSTRISPNQPKITVSNGPKGGNGGTGTDGGIPGRLTVDDALNKVQGPIGNRAIAMQGGALFEWGRAELLPQAIQSLEKLGEIIKRNPKAIFVISGHTDHTGTHEGNLVLSQQRADSVRDWLVVNLNIDPMRIRTVGRADDDAFPTLGADKSIDEQAPNRRVEIVIKTHGK